MWYIKIVIVNVIIYFAIVILGTFMVTINGNQSMYNTVSLIQILTLVDDIVDPKKI